MIQIKDTLKNYGKDKELWYYPHQGETYPVIMDTKKGYLVQRPIEEEAKDTLYLVKHKHAVLLDDEMV